MALVNYDNSDSSEYEDDDNEMKPSISVVKSKELNPEQIKNSPNDTHEIKDDLNSSESAIFKLLPKPSTKKTAIVEDDDEFLKKKESFVKPKAKIMVPSLNDFKDVAETAPSKPKLGSTKKSGLLSILPQPKNTVTSSVLSNKFIPNVLTQKSNSVSVKEKISFKSLKDDSKTNVNKTAVDYSDDEEDDIQNDFFSINKSNEVTENQIMIENEKNDTNNVNITNLEAPGVQKMPHNIDAFLKPVNMASNHSETQPNSSIIDLQDNAYSKNYEIENSDNNTESMTLDEEAILKLVGARGRRKKEDIEIVDVNQQEVLQNAREMFMKGLLEDTTKRVSSSKRKGNEPTSQQKRKHQITYLAHQAKANEIELQNQWANNRMTRRQTQSKYGF
ncbi:Proline-rich protein PRCC [Eumeta japonica]|uniref:Proline-rich protein PRCC n=1 Tax=Eumeta variegata TaxID=151549 RepID=A0A4C1W277_EUMVA|nr:Proline-rich protein PRCC [Eumeta japonica]